MARKLTLQQEEAFVLALAEAENCSPNPEFLEGLSKKRDTSLELSPELAFWFDPDFRPRSPFF